MAQISDNLPEDLPEAVGKLTVSESDARAVSLTVLEAQYELLRKWGTPFVDHSDFDTLRMKVVKYPDGGFLQFFEPWPLQRLLSLPIDFSDQDVAEDVERAYGRINYCSYMRGLATCSFYPRLTSIHECFISEVQRWQRRGPDGQTHRLPFLTRWKFFEWYTPKIDTDMIFHVEWACSGGWAFSGSKKYPHFKAAMYTAVRLDPEDQLLRSELLIILGIMIERLRNESLKDHAIIPVMLFSFLGPRCGRVLTAYFDGQHLVVQRLPLLNFPGSPNSDAMFEFVRFQAAGITPGLDTTRFPKPTGVVF
ncbi:hypothetical protein BDW62DRAFT_201588 [Aspergillus aurantiobrunneus]